MGSKLTRWNQWVAKIIHIALSQFIPLYHACLQSTTPELYAKSFRENYIFVQYKKKLLRGTLFDIFVGSIAVTTEFFVISCDSNHVPKWFGTHYNPHVPL